MPIAELDSFRTAGQILGVLVVILVVAVLTLPKGGPRPFWVKLGLWGLPKRNSAWACCWLSVAIAAGLICYGFVNPWFILAGPFMLMAAYLRHRLGVLKPSLQEKPA